MSGCAVLGLIGFACVPSVFGLRCVALWCVLSCRPAPFYCVFVFFIAYVRIVRVALPGVRPRHRAPRRVLGVHLYLRRRRLGSVPQLQRHARRGERGAGFRRCRRPSTFGEGREVRLTSLQLPLPLPSWYTPPLPLRLPLPLTLLLPLRLLLTPCYRYRSRYRYRYVCCYRWLRLPLLFPIPFVTFAAAVAVSIPVTLRSLLSF